MTPEEAVPLLARWLKETRMDLALERRQTTELAARITELEHQISGFAYWMRVGRTPAHIRHLAAELEKVA